MTVIIDAHKQQRFDELNDALALRVQSTNVRQLAAAHEAIASALTQMGFTRGAWLCREHTSDVLSLGNLYLKLTAAEFGDVRRVVDSLVSGMQCEDANG